MTVIKSNGSTLKSNDKILNHKWSVGEGLKFDGVNDYVKTSTFPNLSNKDMDYSVFGILNISNLATYKEFICSAVNTDDRQLEIIYANTFFFVRVGNISNLGILTFPITFGMNTITIVKVGHNLINWKCFVNGSEVIISIANNVYNVSSSYSNNAYIGIYGSDVEGAAELLRKSDNPIYDLKVFNKELTQEEVTELYIKQGQIIPSTAISNCVLDMRFDDKSGTIAKDKSGNNYNGTLTNFTNTSLGAGNSWCDKYGNSITQN